MTTVSSVVQINQNVVFTVVDDEAVLLEQQSGKYFGLDEVGTRMWQLLAEHGSLDAVCQLLLEEYDIDEGQLGQDLIYFVDSLAEKNLLTVTHP